MPGEPPGPHEVVPGAYEELVERHGLRSVADFSPGPVTPLLAKRGSFSVALAGELPGGVEGTIGPYSYRGFRYQAVFAVVAESQPFVPRLFVERRGRMTDTLHYGFELRTSKLWTESAALASRFEVRTGPYQDPNWMRQLFSPSFVDYLATRAPEGLSFELAYGNLLCSAEWADPSAAELDGLWSAAGAIAARIREESLEWRHRGARPATSGAG